MKIIIFVFLLGGFLSADSLYFMPNDAKYAINDLIYEIKNAQSEVKIAIYSFTNREIAKAIRDSAARGVRFKIIFDSKNLSEGNSQIGYLAKLKNIETCTLIGRRSNNNKYNGIMHNKLALIDRKTAIFGSANWSKSAFELNYEMLLISQNKDFIAKSHNYFDTIFRECRRY